MTLVSLTPKYNPLVKMTAKVLRVEHVSAGDETIKEKGYYKEHTELLNRLRMPAKLELMTVCWTTSIVW